MARERLITRTIETAEFTVLGINTINNTVDRVSVLARPNDKVNKILEAASSDAFAATKIEKVCVHQRRYAMKESEFIKLAQDITKEDVNNE